MITLTFDDGYMSQKDVAYQLLKEKNLKGSFYIITDYLSEQGYESYMKKKDICELQECGHEVSSHTKSHPHLHKISYDKVTAELQDSKKVLQDLGFDTKTFVYPYGHYNKAVIQQVKDAGYIGARTTIFGFNDKDTDPYLLKCQAVYRWTPFFLVKYWINKAERKNLWLILMFHQLDHTQSFYGCTPEMFRKIVAYISEKKIQTVTMSEGIQASI